MILLLGDIHADYYILKHAIEKARMKDITCIIQVGDFGLFDEHNGHHFHKICRESHIPIYFIDGNHDDCTRWVMLNEVTRVWYDANLFYVPRGTVMEIDNRTIAFMGGAGSIDKDMRIRYNQHWDENENISSREVERLMDNAKDKKIDMLITHCPPHTVIEEHFDAKNKLFFGVGLDWHDHNQDIIENIWKDLDYPPIYSGHMHKTVVGDSYRILDINELLEV
jgi:Icc-related predicted phosphoesterase